MKKIITSFFLFSCFSFFAQNLDYEKIIKSKPLKVSGIISANSVFYNSNQNLSRQPFTYFLQGTLNVSVYGFSIPINYSYSNQGEDLGYQLPFNFNRLSLHPKYKWITAHIGTVNMSFSPYTLSGHQFTGAGVDLTPKGPLKISAMSGRLLKATEDNGDPRTVPAFDRFGYGLKTTYEKENYKAGIIAFYAKDNQGSLDSIPETRGILPQENLVLSAEGQVKLNKQFTLQAEYATTAITTDTRAEKSTPSEFSLTKPFFNFKSTTTFYNAFKGNLSFNKGRVSLGVGYERIDPGYSTLGAYFFNNDFENITINATNSFFKDKLVLSVNAGLQRDDLNNQKANNTNRTIGAANATLNINKRLSFLGSYSNFTTFTNIKPNQFEDINDSDLTDEAIENLDFRQLSQTANLGVNYVLSEKKEAGQNLNVNYNLNDVANEQGGIVRIGDASTFHNLSISHSIQFSEKEMSINTSLNTTYNTIGREDATTWGPSVSITKSFLKKTLNSTLSSSYNQSNNTSGKSTVTNFRANGSYILKEKHNFSLSAIQLFRASGKTNTLSEFTATFGYNYAFGLKKPSIKFPSNKKEKNDTVKINYKKYHYFDIPRNITPQILGIENNEKYSFIKSSNKTKLNNLKNELKQAEKEEKKLYKSAAITYLKCLDNYINFEDKYYELLYSSFIKLKADADNSNYQIESEYLLIVDKNSKTEKVSERDQNIENSYKQRLIAHKKLLQTIDEWQISKEILANPTSNELKKLTDRYLKPCFNKFDSGATEEELINFLEVKWADYFHKRTAKEN